MSLLPIHAERDKKMGWTEKDKYLNDQDVWAFNRSEEWRKYREGWEPKDSIGIDCWFYPLKYTNGFYLRIYGLWTDRFSISSGVLIRATNRLVWIKPLNKNLPVQVRLVEEMGTIKQEFKTSDLVTKL